MTIVTLQEGALDPWYGTKVKALILASEGNFWVWLVYNSETGMDDVWWRTNDEIPAEIAPIVAREATLEAIRLNSLDASDARAFRTLLANAVGRALDRDLTGASATLDYAERFVRQRLEEAARHWYLWVSLIGGVCAVIVMIATFWITCWSCSLPQPCGAASLTALYAAGMGALGAAVSLISRTGTFSADPAAGKALHLLEASARLAVGAVAGFIAFLALKVGLISTKLLDSGSLGLMLIAFAAGYSERFIAQISQSLEGTTASAKTTPATPFLPPPNQAGGTASGPPDAPSAKQAEDEGKQSAENAKNGNEAEARPAPKTERGEA